MVRPSTINCGVVHVFLPVVIFLASRGDVKYFIPNKKIKAFFLKSRKKWSREGWLILQGLDPGVRHLAKILHPGVQAPRFQVGVSRAPETDIEKRARAAFF
jgi:hypothetical protein